MPLLLTVCTEECIIPWVKVYTSSLKSTVYVKGLMLVLHASTRQLLGKECHSVLDDTANALEAVQWLPCPSA